MSSPHPKEAERVGVGSVPRLDAAWRRTALCGAVLAAWLGTATLRGETAAPGPLVLMPDARPIELNSPAELPGSPQPAAAATLRFSPPDSAAGSRQGAGDAASSAVLRWKTRQGDGETAATGFAPQPAGAWQDRTQKTGPAILPAAHQNAPTAFQDPFGDRSQEGDTGIRLSSPTGIDLNHAGAGEVERVSAQGDAPRPPTGLMAVPQSPVQKPHSAVQKPSVLRHSQRAPSSSQPNVAQRPAADPSLPPLPPAESSVPDFPRPGEPWEPGAPAPAKEKPRAGQPLTPAAPSLGPPSSILEYESRPSDTDCARIYNDRNCCDEERKCSTARQALRDNSITKISLDISAPFKPDATSVEEEQEARENRLRQIPARQWRNRTGQIVADGRLQRIYNRKIAVAGPDGQAVEVRLGELSDDDLCFLAAWWGVPTECTLGDDQYVPRNWELIAFHWKASALCHKPLYFEETGLERYGHTMGPWLEPVHSGAHFFKNVALLPYKMGINPPHECQYALGYYRPGSCAPWLVPPVPISLRGGLLQAGVVLGGVYLIP